MRLRIAAINLHWLGTAWCMVEEKTAIYIFVRRVVCKAAAHHKPILIDNGRNRRNNKIRITFVCTTHSVDIFLCDLKYYVA